MRKICQVFFYARFSLQHFHKNGCVSTVLGRECFGHGHKKNSGKMSLVACDLFSSEEIGLKTKTLKYRIYIPIDFAS